jgi:hypothetical protein
MKASVCIATSLDDLLKGSEASLKHAVTAMGRGRLPGWRADDKAATVAAWLVLASQGQTQPEVGA